MVTACSCVPIPDLKQARRRARELLHAARDGDAGALARLAAVSAQLTLAGAQLALARELGQPSWPALVREIEARNASIPEDVLRFLRSSVNMQIGARSRARTRAATTSRSSVCSWTGARRCGPGRPAKGGSRAALGR